jgi:flagellar protein FliO/FliZ
MITPRIHALLLAVIAPEALAQAAATGGSTGMGSGMLQATLGLALVLGLIWGAAWVVRRLGPVAGTGTSAIKIVAAQNIGPRERVVIVEIGDQWLVLGVATGAVRALHALPKSALPPTSPPVNPFARLLARAKATPNA